MNLLEFDVCVLLMLVNRCSSMHLVNFQNKTYFFQTCLVILFFSSIGAYFGLTVAYVLYDQGLKSTEAEQREKSVYHSDVFAMIGTIFLFCFWPSFNAGLASAGDSRLRAIVNTYLSIASSVLLTFICSCLFSKEKKFDMVHIQNATLAGGVGMFE